MPEIQDIFEDIIIPSNGHELAPLQTKYWKCITERDYEDAIGICEEILQKEKLDVFSWFNLIFLLIKERNFVKARSKINLARKTLSKKNHMQLDLYEILLHMEKRDFRLAEARLKDKLNLLRLFNEFEPQSYNTLNFNLIHSEILSKMGWHEKSQVILNQLKPQGIIETSKVQLQKIRINIQKENFAEAEGIMMDLKLKLEKLSDKNKKSPKIKEILNDLVFHQGCVNYWISTTKHTKFKKAISKFKKYDSLEFQKECDLLMSLCRARTGDMQSLCELLPKNHISEKIISDNFNDLEKLWLLVGDELILTYPDYARKCYEYSLQMFAEKKLPKSHKIYSIFKMSEYSKIPSFNQPEIIELEIQQCFTDFEESRFNTHEITSKFGETFRKIGSANYQSFKHKQAYAYFSTSLNFQKFTGNQIEKIIINASKRNPITTICFQSIYDIGKIISMISKTQINDMVLFHHLLEEFEKLKQLILTGTLDESRNFANIEHSIEDIIHRIYEVYDYILKDSDNYVKFEDDPDLKIIKRINKKLHNIKLVFFRIQQYVTDDIEIQNFKKIVNTIEVKQEICVSIELLKKKQNMQYVNKNSIDELSKMQRRIFVLDYDPEKLKNIIDFTLEIVMKVNQSELNKDNYDEDGYSRENAEKFPHIMMEKRKGKTLSITSDKLKNLRSRFLDHLSHSPLIPNEII